MEHLVIFVCTQMQFQSVECYIYLVSFITFKKIYNVILFFVCFLYCILCLQCFCIFFLFSPFVLSLYYFYTKFTDHCHRVETQLQSINVYHNKSKPMLILCNFIGSSHSVGARLVCCLALICECAFPP